LAVARPVATLGRSSGCDLVVDHSSISRKHAEIRRRESGLLVRDLGSRNGTFVDGTRIRMSEVSPGQVLKFGAVAFGLQAADAIVPDSEEETDGVPDEDRAQVRPGMPTEEILSEAQRRVFELLLTGNPEKTIARTLKLSQHTVHNHVRAILRIFGVHSRVQLLAGVFRAGSNVPADN
jgi:pSer/pThr/pTyr-binding forkhead associated (FHA) protein